MKNFLRKIFLTLAILILMTSNSSAEENNFAQEVLNLCNVERANYGIEPLELDEYLIECADIRAEEIVENFSHTRPDGISCFTILRGISYNTCGENIAAGHSTAEETVEQWMNSEGHRANILNPAFKKLGVGYCFDEDSQYKHYWVQLFIG